MDKESRKRKIVERGSDRMALITGRLHSLDTNDHDHPSQKGRLNKGGDEATDDESRGPQRPAEASEASATTFNDQFPSTIVNERSSRASDDASLPSIERANNFSYFTPDRINSCILSSENTRVVCSITIAVLVVFSHMNLPRNIVKSKSIISSRPLYVLLLTDVSIVVASLIIGRRRVGNVARKGGEEWRLQQDPDNWEVAVKVLEFGMVLYQTIRALFIDCSFYIVIVICGLSFV